MDSCYYCYHRMRWNEHAVFGKLIYKLNEILAY